MPRSEGSGFTSGAGGWTGTHVPLPQGPVKHRPTQRPVSTSPIVLAPVHGPVSKPKPKARPARKSRSTRAPGQPVFRPTRLSRDTVRELVEKYQAGASTTEVAVALGLSKTTVLKYLEAEGVQRRPKHSTKRPVGRPRIELPPKACEACGATFSRRDGERADNYRKRQNCGGEDCPSWTRYERAG